MKRICFSDSAIIKLVYCKILLYLPRVMGQLKDEMCGALTNVSVALAFTREGFAFYRHLI